MSVVVPSTERLAKPRFVGDALVMTWRNLLNIRRTPQLLIFSTVQPVIFVLMFRYVFGGAVAASLPGIPYVDFMMPGIFVQTTVFGALATGVGLGQDLHRGLIDRFRSLPMSRSAVLIGRTLADMLRDLFVVVLMCGVGFAVGWHLHTDVGHLLLAIALLLGFAYALAWIFAIVGLSTPDAETAQAASFPLLAPLVFASSAFIPVGTMPSWLRPWAEHQPVSAVVNAVRSLTLGPTDTSTVLTGVAWVVGIVAVCGPLAVWRYRRAT